MYQTAKPLFLCCETPLHAGSGNDMGLIDMPIQRESNTGFPKVESSSLKGSLRQAYETADNPNAETIHRVFGFDQDAPDGKHLKPKFDNIQSAGCIAITDARILLFPVKSAKGVFNWITCPRVISRFLSDMKQIASLKDNFSLNAVSCGTVSDTSDLAKDGTVGLEEFTFNQIKRDVNVRVLAEKLADILYPGSDDSYWAKQLKEFLVVLSDEDFADFVQNSTEVITRNKIDNETGTASETGLFTEEYLPAETILYSMVLFSSEFTKRDDKMTAEEVKTYFSSAMPSYFQLGANASLGKGIIKLKTI